MGIFSKPRLRSHDRREDMPEGLWVKCPDCGALVHTLELQQNHHVCVHCSHHYLIDSRERITMLADPDSFEETETGLISANPLGFAGYS
jgi:acetyl-CoA carboxylase carboxyl transferase subunit beta